MTGPARIVALAPTVVAADTRRIAPPAAGMTDPAAVVRTVSEAVARTEGEDAPVPDAMSVSVTEIGTGVSIVASGPRTPGAAAVTTGAARIVTAAVTTGASRIVTVAATIDGDRPTAARAGIERATPADTSV